MKDAVIRLLLAPLRRAMGRLVWRIVLAVALGSFFIVALRATLNSQLLRGEVREAIGRQLATSAQRAADDIDARIRQRMRAIALVAAEPGAHRALGDPAAGDRFLADHSVLQVLFDNVVLIDARGRIVADWPQRPDRRGRSAAQHEWFQRARASGQPTLGMPFRVEHDGRAVFNLVAPLRNGDGSFAGVVSGSIELSGSDFFEEVRDARTGDNGHFAVYSVTGARDGVTLLHPDRKRILRALPDAAHNPSLHAALAGARAVHETVHVSDAGRTPVYAAYRELREAPWIVEAVWHVDEAVGGLNRLESGMAVLGVVGALLLAGIVGLVVVINLDPLRRLGRQLDAMDRGERTGSVAIGGPAEIRRVQRAINQLLDTQRKLEGTLRTREAFHRSLSECAPLPIFVTDRDGECTYVNAPMEQLQQRLAKRLVGTDWALDVHADDRDTMTRAWAAAVAARRPFEGEFRLVTNGRTHWMRVHATPLIEDGQHNGHVGVLTDLTAERESREQIAQQKLRSDRILESIDDAIIVVDGSGRVAHFSPAAERLLGWRRQSALGLQLAQVLRMYDETDGSRVDLEKLQLNTRYASERWVCETSLGTTAPVDVVWTRIVESGADAGIDVVVDNALGGVLLLRDAALRRSEARRLAWEAQHDGLTRLANRRGFEAALSRQYETFAFSGVNSVLVLLDLDRFKAVNDGGGHDAGDEMLRAVAQVLGGAIRTSDTAARLGGDEFALLLPGCTVERAGAIASVVRAEIGALRVARNGTEFSIGVSQGIATFALGDEDSQAILGRADAACYRAKAAGRNAIEAEQPGEPEAELFG